MPAGFRLLGKCLIVDAGLGVLVVFSILRSEEMVPDAENSAEIFVPMFLPARMMNAVRLRRYQHVAKNAQIRLDVAMIESGIPGSKQMPTDEGCERDICSQAQKRNKAHRRLDEPFHRVHS